MSGALKIPQNRKLSMLDPFMGVSRRVRYSQEGEIFLVVEQAFEGAVQHSAHLQHFASLQALDHPNLLRFDKILSKEFEDGSFVLKTIFKDPGESLHFQIARRDKPEALTIFNLLYSGLEALSYIGQKKAYHGLITPRSLFQSREGVWKLAMPLSGVDPTEQILFNAFSAHLTTYSSPELFANFLSDDADISHDPDRSDVFSFALCVLEFGVCMPISRLYSDGKIDSIVLTELLEKFRKRYAETPLLSNTLQILLNLDIKLRPDAASMLDSLPPLESVFIELQKLMLLPKKMNSNPEIAPPKPEEPLLSDNKQTEDGLSQASFDTPTFDKAGTPERIAENQSESFAKFPQIPMSFSNESSPQIRDSMDDLPVRVLNFTSFVDLPLYDMASFYDKKEESKKEENIKRSFSKSSIFKLENKPISTEKEQSSKLDIPKIFEGANTFSSFKKETNEEASELSKPDHIEKSPVKENISDTDSSSYQTENDIVLSSKIVSPKSNDLEVNSSIIISSQEFMASADLKSKSKTRENCNSEKVSNEDTDHKSRYSDVDERPTNVIKVQNFQFIISGEGSHISHDSDNEEKEDNNLEEEEIKIEEIHEQLEQVKEDIDDDYGEKNSDDKREDNKKEAHEDIKKEKEEVRNGIEEKVTAYRPPRPTGNKKRIGGKTYVEMRESKVLESEGRKVTERTTSWIVREDSESEETESKVVQ